MKTVIIGMLAHVDAGKTTLSESMLYLSGKIRQLGRVDSRNTYLDTDAIERSRGITVFSKQATFQLKHTKIILLDTPGHVDFSAEMERTLQVLDYAILIINGADGVQGHTYTLWKLLKRYNIPTFIFVNKMDQIGSDKIQRLKEIKEQLDEGCICFDQLKDDIFFEEVALCDEYLMETYLETATIDDHLIAQAIRKRQVFPCYFGAALKLEGVETLLQDLERYTLAPEYDDVFGARVFKITRDAQGNRLTHLKLTGGTLHVKTPIKTPRYEEKINQIRLYSGEKYETTSSLKAGEIGVVTGLSAAMPGEGLGKESENIKPYLEPVLNYQMILPPSCSPQNFLPKLKSLEEELPELKVKWHEKLEAIDVKVMGEVQIEVLQHLIEERFDVKVTFDEGNIVYKETILNKVEGVGHFEPLKHYAEVHLLLEPLPLGSGLIFAMQCSEDVLEKNWQKLVLSHLGEQVPKGVLIGSDLTDVKITLVSGKAHNKHTEGGDFREATFRAVRQGLKKAQSKVLEPYYDYELEIPEQAIGRALADLDQMHCSYKIIQDTPGKAHIKGEGPVVTMRNYHKEVSAYTKGYGRLVLNYKGYAICHNEEEVINRIGYDSERDKDYPTGSIFCAHGEGFFVPWHEVYNYMHVPYTFYEGMDKTSDPAMPNKTFDKCNEEQSIGLDEIDAILQQTFYANQGHKSQWKKRKTAHEDYYNTIKTTAIQDVRLKEKYLLVDGYNIIFAWPELCKIAKENMDGARIQLLEVLCNYQGIKQCKIIVVFDAYKIEGHYGTYVPYQNIFVAYTKEAQTADHYIEKFVHDYQGKYDVTVATSDGLEQMIIRGKGSKLLSARELKEEVERTNQQLITQYEAKHPLKRHTLEDTLTEGEKHYFQK